MIIRFQLPNFARRRGPKQATLVIAIAATCFASQVLIPGPPAAG